MLACVASRRRCGASRYHVGGGDLGHKDLANCRKGRLNARPTAAAATFRDRSREFARTGCYE
jgi:hypothetical protein